MDIFQKADGSAELTQLEFTDSPCPIAALPSLWQERTRPPTDAEFQICQSKLGEPADRGHGVQLGWLATVSRPDICARLARFPANPNNLRVFDIYRINELIKTAKLWQTGRTLKYPAGHAKPTVRPPFCLDAGWGKPRTIHEGTRMPAGRSHAAFGPHGLDGRCRLGYIIGLMTSTLIGPVHLPQWTSKFTREQVKSSLGMMDQRIPSSLPSAKCWIPWK